MQNTHRIRQIFRRILHRIQHRRIALFWTVALTGLALPWIWPAVGSVSQQVGSGDCRVLRVSDGDTITVNCSGQQDRVRLYCIDAPEMKQSPWGQRSRDSCDR